ncbi:MAG TPA: endonuclease III [Nitrososphaerales archaeon]|nr:endonuclease III [Nitrososphaerales archaeon]
MVQKRALGLRKRLAISRILREMRRMVYGSTDKRATALAQLQEAEEGDPFRILIGTILSHRTRDENTTKATENLFSKYKTAPQLASADPEIVRRLIRQSGFYNMKTKNIMIASKQLVDDFGGEVPDNEEDLLKLHSVGRKTANCVLVYAFNKPAIPVDTHVHRISNRLGLVNTKKPEETEAELVRRIPKRYWLEVNDLFVRFGQTTCKPIGPHCSSCSLSGACPYYKTVVAPKHKAS